jgi:hypothetical protein
MPSNFIRSSTEASFIISGKRVRVHKSFHLEPFLQKEVSSCIKSVHERLQDFSSLVTSIPPSGELGNQPYILTLFPIARK